MNYPIIKDYKLDIHQEFDVNKVHNEQYILRENQNVFVPRHAPIFSDSLVLRDDKGQTLTRAPEGTTNGDYRIFRMMGKLSALCAKPTSALIEILNPTLKTFYIDYHSVGQHPLFDRSLVELINDAANDDRLIKWKNIHDKPVVFDPEQHSHSLVWDMVMFQDMIDLFDYWAENLTLIDTDYAAIAVNTQAALVRNYVERNSAIINRMLTVHSETYDAHGLTDVQVGLEKVENIGTATVAEALRGAHKRITPAKLEEVIKHYGYDDDAYLKANVIPISFYGNTSFIPPAVGGSFEGIGSTRETAAMCLEKDGTISFLSEHFDGRVQGLYFSIVSGYPDNLEFNYQSYRYDHTILTAAGVVPTLLAQGGGGEVLMVGNNTVGRWFIALTNGTLDPNYHNMVELDYSGMNASYMAPDYLSIHLMGDYVIIIQAYNPGTVETTLGLSAKKFYRIPKSALLGTAKVTPTLMNLTFTNWDGKSFVNSDHFIWAEPVGSAGAWTQAIHKFTKPTNVTSINSCLYRTQAAISAPIPNNPSQFLLKFISQCYQPVRTDTESFSTSMSVELLYTFNPTTGVMSIMDHKGPATVDYSSNLVPDYPQKVLTRFYDIPEVAPTPSYFSTLFASQSTIPLEDGNLLVCYTNEVFRTPHSMMVVDTGARSKFGSMSKKFTKTNFPNIKYNGVTEVITSPLKNSIYPHSLSYEANGEFFNAVGQKTNSNRMMFYRTVTGEYAVRAGFTNLAYSQVYSRPLSNNVYATNIPSLQPRVGITGDATFLSNTGMTGLGETQFCAGYQGKYWINSAAGWNEGVAADESIQLVGTYTRTTDADGNYNYQPNVKIIYPAAIVKNLVSQLLAGITNLAPDVAVYIIDTSRWPNSNITSRPVIIQVIYGDYVTLTKKHAVATLAVGYTSSNLGKLFTVTSATIKSKLNFDVYGLQSELFQNSYRIYMRNMGQSENVSSLYYQTNGNIYLVINTQYATQFTGNANLSGSRIIINPTTHAITQETAYNQTWEGTSNAVMLPKVGVVNKLGATVSGATADLVQGGSTIYGRLSCYPDPAWQVFFQADVDVIFNGKKFTLPAGMIDLRTIKANPANSTFYLYTRFINNEAKYVISESKTYDTIFNIWIGTITTNANQILSISRENVLLMNGARVSEVKRGGAIPASQGAITEDGSFQWFYPNEVIQD